MHQIFLHFIIIICHKPIRYGILFLLDNSTSRLGRICVKSLFSIHYSAGCTFGLLYELRCSFLYRNFQSWGYFLLLFILNWSKWVVIYRISFLVLLSWNIWVKISYIKFLFVFPIIWLLLIFSSLLYSLIYY